MLSLLLSANLTQLPSTADENHESHIVFLLQLPARPGNIAVTLILPNSLLRLKSQEETGVVLIKLLYKITKSKEESTPNLCQKGVVL